MGISSRATDRIQAATIVAHFMLIAPPIYRMSLMGVVWSVLAAIIVTRTGMIVCARRAVIREDAELLRRKIELLPPSQRAELMHELNEILSRRVIGRWFR